MFENAFKNIDNILHTDSDSATELDYVDERGTFHCDTRTS